MSPNRYSMGKLLEEQFRRSRSMNVHIRGDTVVIENRGKSRFVMQNARKLVEKVEKAGRKPGERIQLLSHGPVCSKSRAYLERQGITVTGKKKR